MIRRCVAKWIWRWETRRPYPIRRDFSCFRPHPCPRDAPCRLVVLATPRTLCDGAWCACSLLDNLPETIGLTIVLDGALIPERARFPRRLFPGAHVLSTSTLADDLGGRAPKLLRFAQADPLGRKLLVILLLQERSDIICSDADVLAFGAMPELEDAIPGGSSMRPLYLQEIGGMQTDPDALNRLRLLGLAHAETLNTGLLYLPRRSLSLDLADDILDFNGAHRSWFVETTVLGALLKRAAGVPLPRDRYVVSVRRQFWGEPDLDYRAIALRHFVTPVRHLMYCRGMPYLRSMWRKAARARRGADAMTA